MIKHLVLVSSLSIALNTSAQNCENVLFSGRVSDSLRPQNFYNLMVVNMSTGRGVFGQPDGKFSVYANEGDTLILSVRDYPKIYTTIVADSNCQHKGVFYLEPKVLELEAVEVRPLKSLEQIKEERASLAMRETRMVTGIDVLQSPITALYQRFSKLERSKRWVAEQEYNDDQKRILKELLRNYVAYDIIELTDEEFEEFIAFLNMDDHFLKTASEMVLSTFVKDKYGHYKRLK